MSRVYPNFLDGQSRNLCHLEYSIALGATQHVMTLDLSLRDLARLWRGRRNPQLGLRRPLSCRCAQDRRWRSRLCGNSPLFEGVGHRSHKSALIQVTLPISRRFSTHSGTPALFLSGTWTFHTIWLAVTGGDASHRSAPFGMTRSELAGSSSHGL